MCIRDSPEPAYTVVRDSPDDTEDVPLSDRRWKAEFSTAEIEAALAKVGLQVNSIGNVTIAKRGPSGRAEAIAIHHSGGVTTIGGNDLRVALDPVSYTHLSNLSSAMSVLRYSTTGSFTVLAAVIGSFSFMPKDVPDSISLKNMP